MRCKVYQTFYMSALKYIENKESFPFHSKKFAEQD